MSGCTVVRSAANGAEALAEIQAEPIDLLITDVRMPIMDGVTLVRRLGELRLEVPSIIFVSGFGDVDGRQMYDLGVEAFLTKPLRLQDLMVHIQRALADRSDLWMTPMNPPPRQVLKVDVESISRTPGGVTTGATSLRIGRGGFSTQSPEPLGLGPVGFACRLPPDPMDSRLRKVLAGHGLVRWNSRIDQTVGIEFVYLDPTCRGWLLAEIAADSPRSFIPLS